MNLFVAKLSPSTTGEDLQEIFSAHGEVKSVKIIMDRETGNSKGYGFVEMVNDEEAKAAIAALNQSELNGKEIVVKEANARDEQPKKDSRPKGGFQKRSGGGFQGRSGGGGFQRRDDNRGGGYQRRDDNRGGGGRRDDNRGGGNRW